VRAHRGRLVHALFNLIDNACRATPEGEVVELAVGIDDDAAWVEICDRGPGPPGGLDARRGTVSPRAHRSVSGSGLGLPAARRFLEAFGARLEFEPRDGGGARCRVLLHRSHAGDRHTLEAV